MAGGSAVRLLDPQPAPRLEPREVIGRALRQANAGAARVAVDVEDRRLALRVQAGGDVLDAGLEEVAVDVGERGRSGIGGIDDVHAAEGDRRSPGRDVEVVMHQHARDLADLQHLARRCRCRAR